MTTKITDAESSCVGGSRILNPHPDGKPWGKCCTAASDDKHSCQCFVRKPQDHPSRYDHMKKSADSVIKLEAEGGKFYCIHQKDGEYNRECAGWFAKVRSKQDYNAHVFAFRTHQDNYMRRELQHGGERHR